MIQKEKAWRCSVCGYVHRGPEPPDFCPVCGSSKEMFEPYEGPKQQKASAAPKKWQCMNCGYVHEGPTPPDICPVCGAPAERFEPYQEKPSARVSTKEAETIVVIGGGIAGVSAAESARKTSPQSTLILVSKEPELPYHRLNLTRYLAGELKEEHLPIYPEKWYSDNAISLIREVELLTVDPKKKLLKFKGSRDLNYDRLILAIGSHPYVPPFPGVRRENVTTLRTKKDADRILSQIHQSIRCLVIGGGLLGLETAGALAKKGVDVTLLEGFGWLLPRQLNQRAGDILEDHIRTIGLKLRKSARTKEIIGDELARGVILESGDTVPADLVIIATGVRSNSYLARLTGLDVNKGVIVDNRLQTSVPDIFAAGDVAEHRGVTYGTWGPSRFQGAIAGINAGSGDAEFAGIPRSNMLKVLGIDLFSIGRISAEDASDRTVEDTDNENYFRFLFRDNHMIGAVLLGDTAPAAQVKHIIETKMDCSQMLIKNPSAADVLNFLRSR